MFAGRGGVRVPHSVFSMSGKLNVLEPREVMLLEAKNRMWGTAYLGPKTCPRPMSYSFLLESTVSTVPNMDVRASWLLRRGVNRGGGVANVEQAMFVVACTSSSSASASSWRRENISSPIGRATAIARGRCRRRCTWTDTSPTAYPRSLDPPQPWSQRHHHSPGRQQFAPLRASARRGVGGCSVGLPTASEIPTQAEPATFPP
jgi:hypothetical protein